MNDDRYIWGKSMRLMERYAVLFLIVYIAVIVIACLYPFNFRNPNHVSGGKAGGIEFSGTSIAYSKHGDERFAGVKRFSLHIRFMPQYSPFNLRMGQIFGSGTDEKHCNFALLQKRKDFCLVLGNTRWDGDDCILRIRDIFRKPVPVTIELRYDGKVIRSFVDGLPRDSSIYERPLDWDGSLPVVAGNSGDLKYPWSGRIDTLSFSAEISLSSGSGFLPGEGAEFQQLLGFSTVDSSGRFIHDQSPAHSNNLEIPAFYRPYNWIMLEFFPCFCPTDIVMNILGFLPLGFFLQIYFRTSKLTVSRQVVVSLLAGFLLSLMMEILQAFLPFRNSGWADVLSNTAGILPGYYIAQFLQKF